MTTLHGFRFGFRKNLPSLAEPGARIHRYICFLFEDGRSHHLAIPRPWHAMYTFSARSAAMY
jgi:hypothetical protein